MEMILLILHPNYKPFAGRNICACADWFMIRGFSHLWEDFATAAPAEPEQDWTWTKNGVTVTVIPIWDA